MQTKKIQFNPDIDVRLIKTIKCSFCVGLLTRQTKHEKGCINRQAIDLKMAKHSDLYKKNLGCQL